jgi:hypothetical protein
MRGSGNRDISGIYVVLLLRSFLDVQKCIAMLDHGIFGKLYSRQIQVVGSVSY